MPDRRAQIRNLVADLLGQIELNALLVDPSGRIRCATARLEAALGCEPYALSSAALDSIFSPRNPDWFSREARKAAAQGCWSGDAVLRRRDGSEWWAHIQACHLPAESPSQSDLIFVFEDVTEQVEVLDALMRRTEELYDRNWELEAINRIGRLLVTNVGLDERLYALLREAVRTVRADGGLVMLSDPEEGCLKISVTTGERKDTSLVGFRLPLDKSSLAAETARSLQTRAVKDVASDPFVDRALARVVGVKSVLSTPICAGGEVLGVLMLGARRTKEFSPKDITLVEIIANQAAFAVQNAILGEAAPEWGLEGREAA